MLKDIGSHPSDGYAASSPQVEPYESCLILKSLSLRRGVTIVTEWWQSEMRRGDQWSPEQVWWHTKIRKEIRNL